MEILQLDMTTVDCIQVHTNVIFSKRCNDMHANSNRRSVKDASFSTI